MHGEGAPRGVTAIGRALEMPKSSVHRLLATLTRRGLVERDPRGLYQPGVGLVALGFGVLEREPIVIAARPVLERFASEVGETFFLVGARADALVVLEKAEGSGFLRASPRIGSSVPIHATAVGKLYLAFAPELVSSGPLVAFTEQTLTDPNTLAQEVEMARAVGLARSLDEWIPGLSVLAAPVRLGERLVGAVALALATPSLEARADSDIEARVRDAAAAISGRLSVAVEAV